MAAFVGDGRARATAKRARLTIPASRGRPKRRSLRRFRRRSSRRKSVTRPRGLAGHPAARVCAAPRRARGCRGWRSHPHLASPARQPPTAARPSFASGCRCRVWQCGDREIPAKELTSRCQVKLVAPGQPHEGFMNESGALQGMVFALAAQMTARESSQMTACELSQMTACELSQMTACELSQMTACELSQIVMDQRHQPVQRLFVAARPAV
jgi:hypothetical protein